MNKEVLHKTVDHMKNQYYSKNDKEIREIAARAFGKESLHYEAIDAYLKGGQLEG
jgi:hypothetical protein